MILTPFNSTDTPGELAPNEVGSSVLFRLDGRFDTLVLQLTMVAGTSLPAATITVQISQDGINYYNFPSGAVTYAAVGVQTALSVTGLNYLRLVVTTEAGTANERVLVTAFAEVTRG